MGILAPLYVVEESQNLLVLKTRKEPMIYSTWIFGFSIVVFLMNSAIRPMAMAIQNADPFFSEVIPLSLTILGISLLGLGVLLCGFRKEIRATNPQGILQARSSFWGFPFSNRFWNREDVLSFEAFNKTPKRYRPELYPRNRPVGFWTLKVHLKTGVGYELDRAPQEIEIRDFKNKLQDFWNLLEKKGPA